MTPITKQEVEEATTITLRPSTSLAAIDFLAGCPILSPEFWVQVGYEIAHRRAERGEEL